MIPTQQDIFELTSLIWSTTLGMDVQPLAPDAATWPVPSVEAQVHITGTWRGVVVLHTSEALAAKVAHQMLNLGRRSATAEDIQDAFGEVANMTGGNIKGLLSDADARMSLPSVVRGRDYTVRVPRAQELVRATLSCQDEPLIITVLQAI
ncbi:MAG: chemotaxis protein CheX [Acidobacteria bacterium]|nr:chemotaxis protein CheX [Acidobacteriota bacterium]